MNLSLDQLKGYRGLLHVEGWGKACAFHYVKTDPDGTHTLITPKTRRTFRTKNNLYPTHANVLPTTET